MGDEKGPKNGQVPLSPYDKGTYRMRRFGDNRPFCASSGAAGRLSLVDCLPKNPRHQRRNLKTYFLRSHNFFSQVFSQSKKRLPTLLESAFKSCAKKVRDEQSTRDYNCGRPHSSLSQWEGRKCGQHSNSHENKLGMF